MQQRGVPGLQTGKKAGVAPEVPVTEHIWREGLSLRYVWEAEFEKKKGWTPKEIWGEGFVAGVELMAQHGSFERSIELVRENRELKAMLQSIVDHAGSMEVTKQLDLSQAIMEAGLFLDGI